MSVMEAYPFPPFAQPVSSLTHLLGAAVFAVLSYFLLRRAWGDWGRVGALGVFAFACIFLLSMSGTFHLLPHGGAGRALLRRLDHAAIFVLIAGTFTPAHAILFRGPERWGTLLLIWAVAATGITLKMIFFTGFPEWLGLLAYLGMGWLGAASGAVLWYRYGLWFILPLIWGALAYTMGALLDFLRWPVLIPGVVGPHDLFHVAVLAGAGFHWSFMAGIARGTVPRVDRSGVCQLQPCLGEASASGM